MDDIALRAGNILLGERRECRRHRNPDAALQASLRPGYGLRAHGCRRRAPRSAGRAIPPWWRSQARAGDILSLKAMPRGARSYLTVERRHRRSHGAGIAQHAIARRIRRPARTVARSPATSCLARSARPVRRIGELGVEPADIALARPNTPPGRHRRPGRDRRRI